MRWRKFQTAKEFRENVKKGDIIKFYPKNPSYFIFLEHPKTKCDHLKVWFLSKLLWPYREGYSDSVFRIRNLNIKEFFKLEE